MDHKEENVPAFTPINATLAEVRAVIPPNLFIRSTSKGLAYFARDLILAATLSYVASWISPLAGSGPALAIFGSEGARTLKWGLWMTYWWFQGLVFTGIWMIGHEAGHGALSEHRKLCSAIGFVCHSFLLTPYFSWRASHHRHHNNHGSMERDETYIPDTRSELGIPKAPREQIDWEDYFGDTPVYTLLRLVFQQLVGFQWYLAFNVCGQKSLPKSTSHFNPHAVLFHSSQKNSIIASDIGVLTTAWAITEASRFYGFQAVLKYYLAPWICLGHWIVIITYLHHSAPQVPHYRSSAWTFQRGALCTVDRSFLGWQGRFFLHDISHFHIIHHFFPKMPFYNGEEATRYLKKFLGEQYLYDDRNVFVALWESFNDCQFVEDEGNIIFYRDKKGRAARRACTEDKKTI